MSQLPLKDQYTSAVTGVFGDSSTTYLLVQSGTLSPQYGSGVSYMLKALTLSGSAAGSVLDVPNNITVTDNLTFNATLAGGGGGGGGGGGLSKRDSWILGVCVALVALCFCYGWWTSPTIRGIILFD